MKDKAEGYLIVVCWIKVKDLSYLKEDDTKKTKAIKKKCYRNYDEAWRIQKDTLWKESDETQNENNPKYNPSIRNLRY